MRLLWPHQDANGKIKYPEMVKKSTHLFKGVWNGIDLGKAVESSFSEEKIKVLRRDWIVRSGNAYNDKDAL